MSYNKDSYPNDDGLQQLDVMGMGGIPLNFFYLKACSLAD